MNFVFSVGMDVKQWSGALWMTCICSFVANVTNVVQYINQTFNLNLKRKTHASQF